MIDTHEVQRSAQQCNLVTSETREPITKNFTHHRRIISKVNRIQQPAEMQLGEVGHVETEWLSNIRLAKHIPKF